MFYRTGLGSISPFNPRIPQLEPPACLEFDDAEPNSWAWLHMAPFSLIRNDSTIVLDFRETGQWWEGGMESDLVQLCNVGPVWDKIRCCYIE